MKTITLKNWEEFDEKISSKHYRKWIFRGQSDAKWILESSLYRAFQEAQKIHTICNGAPKKINKDEHEKVMIDRFKCNAHIYLDHLPDESDLLSWLSLMQHHGSPTRLLDFTFSPYIALFFALEFGEGDAAVFCVNHNAIIEDDDSYWGEEKKNVYSRFFETEDNNDEVCLFAFEPTFSNHRLLSQQGVLVATNHLSASHQTILANDYDIKDNDFIKIIIPSKLRYSGLRKLNLMNINSGIIYPGIDGFCKTMRRQPVFGLEWQKRVGNSE